MHIRTAPKFREWLDTSEPGTEVVYSFGACADAALAAFEHDKVILFQRRSGKGWDYCAQRVSARTAGWLARMSASVKAPYNPWAHEDVIRA